MKNLNILFLFGTILLSTNLFADDDVWFIYPHYGQTIQGPLTIKANPPYNGKATIRVKIQQDSGWERTVWRGKLTLKNNYTTVVDISKFRPGPYELEASYWIWGENFDGNTEFWIAYPNNAQPYPQQSTMTVDPNAQYYPQY